MTLPILVVGNTSVAAFAVMQALQSSKKNGALSGSSPESPGVIWAKGSGHGWMPLMPAVHSEKALSVLFSAIDFLGWEPNANPVETGLFHRVWRNKAFKLPVFKRGITLDAQEEALDALLWGPEKTQVSVREYRVGGLLLTTLLRALREKCSAYPGLTVIEEHPLVDLSFADGQIGKAKFSHGKEVEFSRIFYGDRFSDLKTIPELAISAAPALTHIRSSEFVGLLQVYFDHPTFTPPVLDTGLMIPMSRDTGEQLDRNVMGFFTDNGSSVWSAFITLDEGEDNHAIMKRLRKMKQALAKAFDQPDFMAAVTKERVVFEPRAIVAEGKVQNQYLSPRVRVFTEITGLSRGLEMIADEFQVPAVSFSEHNPTNL